MAHLSLSQSHFIIGEQPFPFLFVNQSRVGFINDYMEGEIKAKLKAINLSNPIEALKKFLQVRPVNVRDKKTIGEDLQGFHMIISKMADKEQNSLVQALDENECELVLDYLHRFMQYLGDSELNVATGSLLSLHEKIVAKHGPSIIINAVSRPDCLVSRVVNF